ncbi:MAG: hypothetical protein ACSLE5_08380, partial [Porticoccaceae bacterium]
MIFGQTGAAVPYEFEIVYDTARGGQPKFIPTGSALQPDYAIPRAVHDWFGYSKAGIVTTRLKFGTQTWTKKDLMPVDISWSREVI